MSSNKPFKKEVYQDWKNKYLAGSTMKDIGDEYGVSKPTVAYHLKKMNVERRTNAESHLKNVDMTNSTPSYKQKQMIIGSVLGDGCITKQHLYSFLQISHAESQREWLTYKTSILGNFVSEKGIITRKGAGEGRQRIVEVRTYQNKYINDIYNLTYIDGKKKLSNVFNLVDPLALAVMWGDDGSYGLVSNKYEYGILSLCNFSFEENEMFSNFLFDKFTVRSTVLVKRLNDKEYPQIRINSDGIRQLRSIIREFLPKSMQYKIGR